MMKEIREDFVKEAKIRVCSQIRQFVRIRRTGKEKINKIEINLLMTLK
jgi:hypothetical protein